MRTEDGYIIQKCLDGDTAAFGLIVDKYRKSIYALAYSRVHNFHDAQDITQEAFLKAYRNLRSLRNWDNFVGWLYRITSNLCKNLLRSNSRRPDHEFVEDQEQSTLDHPSMDAYQEGMVYESIQEALDLLPEMYREVLTLRYFGGMNIREISRFLGTSPSTIDRRLREARVHLKEEILVMMSTTYEQHELSANFTFRIVEAVKQIKIHPMPRAAGLPWGLSFATGIIITVLSLSPHLGIFNIMEAPMSSAIPAEMKVLKTGEISVDILKVSQIPALASKQGDGDKGVSMENAFFLAPRSEGNTWTKKADMTAARVGLSTSVLDGKIYALGGYDGQVLSTVEEYDPATDTWTRKADMPTARTWLKVSAVNGKIYAIGGRPNGKVLSTVEEYDPATDTWARKADMPTARASLSTSVANGKIYAIGGLDATGKSLSAVEEYDPATDTWTRKADMPTARGGASSVVNGKIYVIGGDSGPGATPALAVEEYDPATDTWTKKADMPTAKVISSICAVNGRIYIIGGSTTGFPYAAVVSTVEQYDPATDTWTKKANMPAARFDSSISAMNGKIYAIGGSTTGYPWTTVSTVEEYDTGFVPIQESSSIGPSGKLAKPWGRIKSD